MQNREKNSKRLLKTLPHRVTYLLRVTRAPVRRASRELQVCGHRSRSSDVTSPSQRKEQPISKKPAGISLKSLKPCIFTFFIFQLPPPISICFLTKTNTENPNYDIQVKHLECTWNVTCDVGWKREHARDARSSAVLVYVSPHSARQSWAFYLFSKADF